MILIPKQIRSLGLIEPCCERTVFNGLSYGLGVAGYDIRIRESMTLMPNQFALGSSWERFKLPNDVMALIKDKSTWARRGLSVFNTVAEPGWEGYLTLELKNQGDAPLVIEGGSPIAQVLFCWTDGETGGYSGKYQNQQSGPQKARYERTN